MNPLMLHVERIVRPVRAFEFRKLRMRRELLAHLQAAVEEERTPDADEATAIRRSLERLGNPIELTSQLQRTVPWHERWLLAKLPLSQRAADWEVRSARRIFGIRGISLLHMSILCALGVALSAVPCFMSDLIKYSVTHSGISPAHPGPFFLGILIIWQLIYLMSCRFVAAAADPGKWPGALPAIRATILRAMILRAAAILGLQISFTLVATTTAFDRLPTPAEISRNVAVTVVVLICSILIARAVALLRRPYAEWLTLDIAG